MLSRMGMGGCAMGHRSHGYGQAGSADHGGLIIDRVPEPHRRKLAKRLDCLALPPNGRIRATGAAKGNCPEARRRMHSEPNAARILPFGDHHVL